MVWCYGGRKGYGNQETGNCWGPHNDMEGMIVEQDTVVRTLSTGKYWSQLDLRECISLKLKDSIVSFIFMNLYMINKNNALAYRSVQYINLYCIHIYPLVPMRLI